MWLVDVMQEAVGELTLVRLVHDAHYYFILLRILCRQLAPQTGEVTVFGSTLTNDLSVPAGVVVNIDNTVSTSDQTSLDQGVVFGEIRRVQRATDLIIDEVLPPNGQSERVQTIVVNEVLHLTRTILTVVLV